MALSSLRPRYHVPVFTVDLSQWRGAHSFWPCIVNILEHSKCSGASPGTLYLNNIVLYIDIYIVYIIAPPNYIMNLKRLCRVLRRLWFFHNLQYKLNRDTSAASVVVLCNSSWQRVIYIGSGQRAPTPPGKHWGSGQRAAVLRWETITGNNPFILHVGVQSGLQGVKAKVPFRTTERLSKSQRSAVQHLR